MKRMTLALAAILATTGLAAAQASGGTVGGAVGGAATGAVVGGPVGAVVGGVAGAVIGTAIDPPPAEVRSYVVEQQPSESVVVSDPVVVGEPLPDAVVLYEVPQTEYRYAYVNERRVIVEPGTRRVIEVIE